MIACKNFCFTFCYFDLTSIGLDAQAMFIGFRGENFQELRHSLQDERSTTYKYKSERKKLTRFQFSPLDVVEASLMKTFMKASRLAVDCRMYLQT